LRCVSSKLRCNASAACPTCNEWFLASFVTGISVNMAAIMLSKRPRCCCSHNLKIKYHHLRLQYCVCTFTRGYGGACQHLAVSWPSVLRRQTSQLQLNADNTGRGPPMLVGHHHAVPLLRSVDLLYVHGSAFRYTSCIKISPRVTDRNMRFLQVGILRCMCGCMCTHVHHLLPAGWPKWST
jgi:hypothetical protein